MNSNINKIVELIKYNKNSKILFDIYDVLNLRCLENNHLKEIALRREIVLSLEKYCDKIHRFIDRFIDIHIICSKLENKYYNN